LCETEDVALDVETIQNYVERGLMATKRRDVAKAYVLYRNERNQYRNAKENLSKKYEQLNALLNGTDEESNKENSNKDTRIIPTMRDYIAGFTCRELANEFLLPKDISEAHTQGIIHFHDSDYSPTMPMHNCFDKNTLFISNKGVKAFKDFSEGDELLVPTHTGEWKKGVVKKYSPQRLYKITFKRGPWTTKVVYATSNHRWLLKDGKETTSLKVGDYLIQTPSIADYQWSDLTVEQKKMWCYGFAYGDGTKYPIKNGQEFSSRVRLCGTKNKYKNYFIDAGYNVTYPENLKGEGTVCIPNYNKDALPKYLFDNLTNIKIFIHGFLCADGTRNYNKKAVNEFKGVQITGKKKIENIKPLLEIAGYYISNEDDRSQQSTNYGKRTDDTVYFQFQAKQTYRNWRVLSIEETERVEDVWCLEVEDNHSFILSNGIVTGNCDLINLEDMLQNGTVISGTLIEKPHKFSTACTIATQIITQVASSQYGGQSVSVEHLAPFVEETRKSLRKEYPELNEETIEKMTKRDIKDGIQTIQYQLITMSTTNGQAPFVSLFMYLNEAKSEKEKEDLALIIEEILKQRIEGVKNPQGVPITTAFPKLLYVLDEENMRDGKYYYLTMLAAECSAKRLVPDYISAKKMKELKHGDVYPCMGCRSFLHADPINHKYYGKFNQGVVTINLPYLACLAREEYPDDVSERMKSFWGYLYKYLHLCYDALMIRHNSLVGTKSDVAPILWQHGALARLKPGEEITPLLYNGNSSISLGYAGLWECVYGLIGEELISTNGKDLGLEIMRCLNNACEKWKKETNIYFSVYGSPIESTTFKFAKALQKRFGIIEGVTDKKYVTNSYHITPSKEIDAFSKLSFESEFQALSPGGAISYVEVPNMTKNIPAMLEIIKHIYDTILYAEINTMTSYCQVCGCKDIKMQDNLEFKCPQCGNNDFNKMNIALRICGYISTNPFNEGRAADIHDRVYHVGME
jgi:ribonucleoside-triphosphate reductase